MFAISFRIFVGEFAGQKVYVNGSAPFIRPFDAGRVIVVRADGAPVDSSGSEAEVIESVPTKREVEDFKWDVLYA